MVGKEIYKSEAMKAIRQTAAEMYALGIIDEMTMCDFDEACLTGTSSSNNEVS
jgi:DNA-binding transcriptional regulator YiaG